MLKDMVKRVLPGAVILRYEHELRKETHINRALRIFDEPTTYVEIGVRDGECIRQIEAARKIAVDPAPVSPSSIGRDGTRVMEMTSDRFFAEAAPNLFASGGIHVALADGLHEFRQTLRDIQNLERHMVPGGVIFVHDCNPPTRRHAEDQNGPWNGDVWKIAPYLMQYRPELGYFTLDCDWGLGVVTSFSGDAPMAAREGDIETIASLDFDDLQRGRKSMLRLRSPLSAAPYFLRRRLGRS
jgi:Methyltransferase domain